MTDPPVSPEYGHGSRRDARRAEIRTRWLARTWDRVPTGWFAGILTAAFLGVTAAFGGLAAVAAAPLPELGAGDTHENGPFALTIERAVLIDDLPEAGIFLDEDSGQRVLALVLTVENVWTEALPSGLDFTGEKGVVGAVRLPELDGAPAESVARFDDTTVGPWLQPGLPAQLVLTWPVDADRFEDGDELRIDLRNYSLYTGTLVVDGTYWVDPTVAAHVTVPIDDVGAGADADADGAGE